MQGTTHDTRSGAAPAVGRLLPGERTELDLGPARLLVLRPPGPPARPGVRWSAAAPGTAQTWQVVLASGGPLTLSGGHDAVRLAPGELALWAPPDTAPAMTVRGTPSARAVAVCLPCRTVPAPARVACSLTARPLPSSGGAGALLSDLIEGLATQAALVEARQALWLGSAVVDLTVALLSGVADLGDPARSRSRQATLLDEIKTYVDLRLANPELAPLGIARAHHISLRYVHHLFQQDKQTVRGYIRERRLEHCRADLLSPGLATESVGRIMGRWGFRDAAVFGRAFKRAYGLSPAEYRRRGARAPR
ncbi:helix-turn-helix domain-containing protein [Streptomyces sp. NPDC020480]|uniref:helix-turn-helix domain-containing protein n=1 Tax=Streptomyces sp. NPDC020480 TaxID=3365076 RepID=UPI0037A438F9